jgi:dTDP-4-amino-4,6-dideoxygalactose transaminase
VDVRESSYERRFAANLDDDMTARAFWKGRVALYALLRALGIGVDHEIVLPGFTCVVVPNAMRLVGATPVYADIEADGYNLDPVSAAECVTHRTRALLVQHTFGIPARMRELVELARRHDLLLIEDCAHVIGGEYEGRRLGTFGDAAFFSFQWSKPYTTGLGGMAIARFGAHGDRLAEVQREASLPPRAARLRLRAQVHAYRWLYTPRLAWRAQDAFRAASARGLLVGSSSEAELEGELPTDHGWRMARAQERAGERLLLTVPGRNAHAQALARLYDEKIAAAGWAAAARPETAALLRYPLQVMNKQPLLRAARAARVEMGTWFESPLHPVPLEKHLRFGYIAGQCPRAELAARRLVNLPLHPRVSAAEALRIADFFLQHAERPAP